MCIRDSLRQPNFSQGLTKLAILSDYKRPGMLCLALPACQKLGLILVIKWLKIDFIKNANNKKCASKFVFFNEKKMRKIWMIFDIEN